MGESRSVYVTLAFAGVALMVTFLLLHCFHWIWLLGGNADRGGGAEEEVKQVPKPSGNFISLFSENTHFYNKWLLKAIF